MRPLLILASVLIMALPIPAVAQQQDTTVQRPPYLILNHEHLIILFEAEESALKALPDRGQGCGRQRCRPEHVSSAGGRWTCAVYSKLSVD
jgi:hypothetical protein